MSPELLLRGAGLLMLGLCTLHLVFPQRFEWKRDLAQLQLINRQIFYVHTVFVCLVLLWMGAVALFDPAALLERSRLAGWVNGGTAVFWFARLYVQFFGYSSELWRGKPLETAIHILFTGFWAYLTAVFAWAWWLTC